jgi:3-dehydroquinate synthetase
MAVRYSRMLGLLEETALRACLRLMEVLELPLRPPDLSPETVRFRLGLDKKKDRQRLNLILLRGCGEALIHPEFLEEVVRVWPALCLSR